MKIVLVAKRQEAKDTLVLIFKPQEKVNYLPGDFIYLPVNLTKPDPRGNLREFSLSSSPTEEKFEIVTRLRSKSEYKKTLNKIVLGEEIEIDPPMGTLHLDIKTKKPQIFIAGGTGIAPFKSRIKYLIDKKLHVPIYVLYSNHSREDIAFKADLDSWSAKYSWLKITYVVSKEEGRINQNKLADFIASQKISNADYWVTGSHGFVDDIEDMLLNLRIPSDQIITEKFTGY